MKICVFGGTFDPPHLGHENIINELLIKFDKVIIVPSKKTPRKKEFPSTNNLARLEMLSLCSFAKDSNCIISDYEIMSDKFSSYTIDTIRYLKNKFKNYYKSNSALSVSSCTTGLQLILSYLNLLSIN